MLQPKDTDWLNGLKKNKTHIYILSKRDPLQIQGHIQTESEGWAANGYQKKAGVAILL